MYKKLISAIMTGAMLCGLFMPVQPVLATASVVEAGGGTTSEQTQTENFTIRYYKNSVSDENLIYSNVVNGTAGDEINLAGIDVNAYKPADTEELSWSDGQIQNGAAVKITADDTDVIHIVYISTVVKKQEPSATEAGADNPDTAQEKINTDPDFVLTKLSPADARVIVLDPGHCKTHPGASQNGLREEEVVLDIAKACQSKLDEYGDVTVYMTRTSGACCTKLGLGDCLSARTSYGKYLDADFLISMHINAGASSGANALVAYQSGYHDNVRKETQAFGKIVLSKLQELGVANRGFLLRKSGTGNRYSNGKLADYYSIVRRGVVFNIPSMIIEHGFVTSTSDCNKFFRTKAKRTKLGKADADAIISYYDLNKKVIKGKMDEQDEGTYFVTSKGKKALGWVKYNAKWYFFDKLTGIMKTGMIEDEGKTYFLDKQTGQMKVGWIKDGSSRYFARGDGSIVKDQPYSDGVYTYLFNSSGKQLKMGLHTIKGKTYYVNKQKRVLTGALNIEGKYYLFDNETGEMRYGYVKQGSKYYYADKETGVLARNKILTVKGNKYYFGKKGARQSGWVKYKGAKYYFSTVNGKMIKGWKKIKGKYYYFSKTNGKMQKKKWIGKYYVNSKGIRTKKKK